MTDEDESLTEFLNDVEGLVEANRFERQMLWSKHHRTKRWEENLAGIGREVGKIGGKSIFISLNVDVINGQRILFWEATSVAVDHDRIRAWFETVMPRTAYDGDRLNSVDAANFTNVLRAPAGSDQRRAGPGGGTWHWDDPGLDD